MNYQPKLDSKFSFFFRRQEY